MNLPSQKLKKDVVINIIPNYLNVYCFNDIMRGEIFLENQKILSNEVFTIERTFLSKVSPVDVVSKVIQTIVLAGDDQMQYNSTVDVVAMNGDCHVQ